MIWGLPTSIEFESSSCLLDFFLKGKIFVHNVFDDDDDVRGWGFNGLFTDSLRMAWRLPKCYLTNQR